MEVDVLVDNNICENLVYQVSGIIIVDQMFAKSVSADYVHVFGDMKVDYSLFAMHGYIKSISAIEVTSSIYNGDGSGVTNLHIESFNKIIGDGITNTFIVNHNYNTMNVRTQIYDTINGNFIYTSITNIDNNNVLINFKHIPTINSYNVVIFPARKII